MVSITRCKSSHKLKNLCSKGKPHWFFARISLTVVGLAASSFGFRVRGVLTKALALRFRFLFSITHSFEVTDEIQNVLLRAVCCLENLGTNVAFV